MGTWLSLKHFAAEISKNLSESTPGKFMNRSYLREEDPGSGISSSRSWSSWTMDVDAFQQDGWHQWERQKLPIYFDYVLPASPLKEHGRTEEKRDGDSKSKAANFNWPKVWVKIFDWEKWPIHPRGYPGFFLSIQRITGQLSWKLFATETAELGIHQGGTDVFVCSRFSMPAAGRKGALLFCWW